ncbi:GntT/GntP/DsdX family permease, partial [Xenorhabdus bovienii]|uniref:GntT/GntP/DsdX family permease n=1 Tax=Xenorhabdus bovienii TaxID=40576 RepID=UPI003F6B7D44|nr:GntP family permease [Xenorhabdus bovienii]
CVIGITCYAKWLETKYPEYQLDDAEENAENLQQVHQRYMEEKSNKSLPSLFLSLLPIVVPIVLILAGVINGLLLKTDVFAGKENDFYFQ